MKMFQVLLQAILLGSFYISAVEIGQGAPDFSLSTYGGGTFNLSDHQGKIVVILTVGCN